MKPQYSIEELKEISKNINRANISPATSTIPFYIGQENLKTYINDSLTYWDKELRNKDNVFPSFAQNAIDELERLKITLFCDFEELPLNIEGKFKEIINWRLNIGK